MKDVVIDGKKTMEKASSYPVGDDEIPWWENIAACFMWSPEGSFLYLIKNSLIYSSGILISLSKQGS